MFGLNKPNQAQNQNTTQAGNNQSQSISAAEQADKDSVQAYLDIAEIRDNVVVLKNGGLRAVLLVSSVNFMLKSQDEQQGLIQGYQSFLNSLEFPVQILIQSRPLDLQGYVEKLKSVADKQQNTLLKAQTLDYIEYIQQLVNVASIMTKRFFVVVPYSAVNIPSSGLVDNILNTVNPLRKTQEKVSRFEKQRGQLFQRVDVVAGGLRGMGLQTVLLHTQELIELFYEIYNPDASLKHRLPDVRELALLHQEK